MAPDPTWSKVPDPDPQCNAEEETEEDGYRNLQMYSHHWGNFSPSAEMVRLTVTDTTQHTPDGTTREEIQQLLAGTTTPTPPPPPPHIATAAVGSGVGGPFLVK